MAAGFAVDLVVVGAAVVVGGTVVVTGRGGEK